MQAQSVDWNTAPLPALIKHIVSRHHEYLKLELPRLAQRLNKAMAARENTESDTLARLADVFYPMQEELELHMHKEELMLFPAIEQLARSGGAALFPFGSLSNPIRVMMAEHDSAFDGLAEIRRMTRNYELPADARANLRELFAGFDALERDLRQHIHLENEILFPRALSLEAHQG